LRVAALAAAWLAAFCAAMLLGVALPLPARIGLCLGAATFGLTGIRSCFLLAGNRSVRALAWGTRRGLGAFIGPRRIEVAVSVAGGSFRLGRLGLLLWFEACDGIHTVFIDAGKQEICAIRRLCRRLEWAPEAVQAGESGKLLPSGPKV